ncbi:TonB-dependent receptor [uncultured Proteiniphilum sp.]|uniref:TonB-dependent receptor plug domain-containing protein n=1 Tax=uncultured Proteiniphilum sp. TaxID=497637 RepID=UPI0026284C0B|nr:TonB-dependent receptor [uncultured Proteiniphilum sp.]
MQKILVAAFFLAGCCFLVTPVSAQPIVSATVLDSAAYDTLLDEIVVTGTRSPKILKNSPVITKVFTENEIRKVDVTHIGELLQSELPGIEFIYSMNQQVSLNMQGFGGNSVLFLVDGERIAGETLDNIDYSRLNLDNVERIEIIKGAASSLYGSNAVGGVVNIITKTPVDPLHVNFNSRFASSNEQRHGGSISFNTGRLSSATNVQYASAGELKMKNEGVYSKVYGNRTLNVKERLQYNPGDNFKLTGRAGYFFRERDSQVSSKDRYRSFSGGAKGEYAFHEKSNLELAYSFDQYDKSSYLIEDRLDVRNYSNVQHGLKGLYNYSFDTNNTLTIGGDYLRDYLMSYQFKDNGNYLQYVADVFAQYDWTPVEKLNIIGGLRYDYFSDAGISHVSPKIGLMLKQGRFTFRGSYAGGFRAPTLKEMYMNFDMASVFMIYGNRDLKAESSHNFSLSGEYTKQYYNFLLTGYHNLVDNRITTVWNQELKGMQYTNIDKINITGIDVNASARFPCGIGARLSYTFTRENIQMGQPTLSQTRPHAATARIEYGKTWKNYSFNIALNGRALSKLTANEYTSLTSYEEVEEVTYPGYTIWKLSLMQTFRQGINLIVGIDNLFNYVPAYYYSNSPYTTGATFSAGISVDINKFF